MLLELYHKVINPTDQSINWQDYMMFCELDDYPNWKDNQEIILHIRTVLNEYRDKRYDEKSNNNNKKTLKNEDNFDRIKEIKY